MLRQLPVAAPSGLRPLAFQSPSERPVGTALTDELLRTRLSANPNTCDAVSAPHVPYALFAYQLPAITSAIIASHHTPRANTTLPCPIRRMRYAEPGANANQLPIETCNEDTRMGQTARGGLTETKKTKCANAYFNRSRKPHERIRTRWSWR